MVDDDFDGQSVLTVARERTRAMFALDAGDAGAAIYELRQTMQQALLEVERAGGAEEDPDSWPEEPRELVFGVLTETIQECGGSRLRACLLLGLRPWHLGRWARSKAWLSYHENPEDLRHLHDLARRAALGFTARLLTRHAASPTEAKVQRDVAVQMLKMIQEERGTFQPLTDGSDDVEDKPRAEGPAWQPTRAVPRAEEEEG